MVMGGGGAPKHIQFHLLKGQRIDHPREPPEIVYSGGDSPGRGENVNEKGGFLLQNREFVILGQKMADICYGLGRFAGRSRRMTKKTEPVNDGIPGQARNDDELAWNDDEAGSG